MKIFLLGIISFLELGMSMVSLLSIAGGFWELREHGRFSSTNRLAIFLSLNFYINFTLITFLLISFELRRFLLDVVFYGNGLFSGQVTKAMGIVSTTQGEALAALILQVHRLFWQLQN